MFYQPDLALRTARSWRILKNIADITEISESQIQHRVCGEPDFTSSFPEKPPGGFMVINVKREETSTSDHSYPARLSPPVLAGTR